MDTPKKTLNKLGLCGTCSCTLLGSVMMVLSIVAYVIYNRDRHCTNTPTLSDVFYQQHQVDEQFILNGDRSTTRRSALLETSMAPCILSCEKKFCVDPYGATPLPCPSIVFPCTSLELCISECEGMCFSGSVSKGKCFESVFAACDVR